VKEGKLESRQRRGKGGEKKRFWGKEKRGASCFQKHPKPKKKRRGGGCLFFFRKPGGGRARCFPPEKKGDVEEKGRKKVIKGLVSLARGGPVEGPYRIREKFWTQKEEELKDQIEGKTKGIREKMYLEQYLVDEKELQLGVC